MGEQRSKECCTYSSICLTNITLTTNYSTINLLTTAFLPRHNAGQARRTALGPLPLFLRCGVCEAGAVVVDAGSIVNEAGNEVFLKEWWDCWINVGTERERRAPLASLLRALLLPPGQG